MITLKFDLRFIESRLIDFGFINTKDIWFAFSKVVRQFLLIEDRPNAIDVPRRNRKFIWSFASSIFPSCFACFRFLDIVTFKLFGFAFNYFDWLLNNLLRKEFNLFFFGGLFGEVGLLWRHIQDYIKKGRCTYYSWLNNKLNLININIDMASIFGNLFKRVIRVKIDGQINQKLSDKISQGLKKASKLNAQAIFVIINSPSGSMSQTKYISDAIKQYSAVKNVPVYCFAEDQCLGSANALLTSGVKCYANSMTLMGDYSFAWSSIWLKKFADKYNIKQEYIHGGENKVKFNIYEDIKPESEKWMQNYLYLLEHDLKVSIINNRNTHFMKNKLQRNDIEEKIFSEMVIEPSQAVQMGLIDGIKNADELLKEKFEGMKVFDVVKTNNYGKFGEMLAHFRLTS